MEGEQMNDQSGPLQKLYDVLIEGLAQSKLSAPPKLEACFDPTKLMGDLHNLIPDQESEALAYALMMDIRWCIEGMALALGRFTTLHYKGFEEQLQWVAPQTVAAEHIPGPSVDHNYRSQAMVVAYILFEVYGWMIAVWDRLGLLLNLMVFGERAVGQKQPGWNRVFNKRLIKKNCPWLLTVKATDEFKRLHAASDCTFRRAYAIRNVLMHRLLVITLRSRQFAAAHGGLFGEVAEKYLLPQEPEILCWNLKEEPEYTTSLCKGTVEAVDAVIDFLRAVLTTLKEFTSR